MKVKKLIRGKGLLKVFMALFMLGFVAFLVSTVMTVRYGRTLKNTSPFKVIDSGIWNGNDLFLWWLDNDRVLFASNETLKPAAGPLKMTVWNAVTGQVAFSYPWYRVAGVRNGQVLFSLKDPETGKDVRYRGPLENVKEYPPPDPDMRIDVRFDLKWEHRDPPATGGPYRDSLMGENYLDILEDRVNGAKGKAVYHSSPNDIGREVPFYRFIYNEYLDAYIVTKGIYDPTEPETRSFFILERNGDLKEVPYPQNLPHGSVDIYPTKQGYLACCGGNKRITLTNPGDEGIYFIQGEKVETIIGGFIKTVSISPDGCKAAFIYARNIKESLFIPKSNCTVKMIDFCMGGDR